MSLREASVTDEKIAIDFVASAHDVGYTKAIGRVTFARQILPRKRSD